MAAAPYQPGTNSNITQPGTPLYTPERTGTGFTNIQKLIGANNNNQLGQVVGGGIQNTANQSNNAINSAENQFQSDQSAANLNTTDNNKFVSTILGGIGTQGGVPAPTVTDSGPTASSTTPAAGDTSTNASTGGATTPATPPSTSKDAPPDASTASDGTKSTVGASSAPTPAAAPVGGVAPTYSYPTGTYAPTTADLTKFQQMMGGHFSGPTSLNGTVQSQATNAATDMGNIQTNLNGGQAGLQGLLQRYVGQGNANYNTGEQNLDAMLLGQTGRNQLAQARLATQSAPNLANINSTNAAQTLGYQNQAADLANNITTQGKATGDAINTAIKNAVTSGNTASAAALNKLYTDFQNNTLSPEETKQVQDALGITAGDPVFGTKDALSGNLFGTVTPNGLDVNGNPIAGNSFSGGTFGNSNYTAQNTVTPQQLAAQQALQQLTGNSGGLNITNPQFGTTPTGPLTTDTSSTLNGTGALAANQASSASDFKAANDAAGVHLSPEELAYINNVGIQKQFDSLGSTLNSLQGPSTENGPPSTNDYAGTLAASKASEAQINAQLAAYDKSIGQYGFDPYASQINDIGNYGGKRGWAQGEGVSAFLKNLSDQQTQSKDLQNGNGYYSNLKALLGNNGRVVS